MLLALFPGIPYLYINAASCSGVSVLCTHFSPVLAIRAGIPPPCSPQQQAVIKVLPFYLPDRQISSPEGILIHPATFYHIPNHFANLKTANKGYNTHFFLVFLLYLSVIQENITLFT